MIELDYIAREWPRILFYAVLFFGLPGFGIFIFFHWLRACHPGWNEWAEKWLGIDKPRTVLVRDVQRELDRMWDDDEKN